MNKLNFSKAVTLMATLLFLFSCKQSTREVIDKYESGFTKTELDFINRKNNTYTEFNYFENGKIKSKKEYVNGKLNGKLINYSEEGYKEQEFDYVDGQKNGIGTAWYESGKIAFQFKYNKGLQYDGTEYFEDGWPRVLVKYSATGKREGKAFYFEDDGHIWMQGFFKNGLEDSVWTKFDKAGNITQKISYKEGQEIK